MDSEFKIQFTTQVNLHETRTRCHSEQHSWLAKRSYSWILTEQHSSRLIGRKYINLMRYGNCRGATEEIDVQNDPIKSRLLNRVRYVYGREKPGFRGWFFQSYPGEYVPSFRYLNIFNKVLATLSAKSSVLVMKSCFFGNTLSHSFRCME